MAERPQKRARLDDAVRRDHRDPPTSDTASRHHKIKREEGGERGRDTHTPKDHDRRRSPKKEPRDPPPTTLKRDRDGHAPSHSGRGRDGGKDRSEHRRERSRSPNGQERSERNGFKVNGSSRPQGRQPEDDRSRGQRTNLESDRYNNREGGSRAVTRPMKMPKGGGMTNPMSRIQDRRERAPIEDMDHATRMMKQYMGFTGFRTTKQTKVPGNDVGGVRKEKKTEYRQYMNRQGGFNRPLSPTR